MIVLLIVVALFIIISCHSIFYKIILSIFLIEFRSLGGHSDFLDRQLKNTVFFFLSLPNQLF